MDPAETEPTEAPDPSTLIAETLGVELEPTVAFTRPRRCTYTGKWIHEGIPGVIGPNFLDQDDLVGDDDVACPYARALVRRGATRMIDPETGERATASPLLTLQAFIVNAHGAWRLRTSAEITRVLEDPPAPPFVAAIATGNSQHLPWRTPVTTSRGLIVIRHGTAVMRVRRAQYQRALAAFERVREAARAVEAQPTRKAIFADGAERADQLWWNPHIGSLVSSVRQAALAAGLAADVERLETLAPAEYWALYHYARTPARVDLQPLPLKGRK